MKKKRKAKPLLFILVFLAIILIGVGVCWMILSSPVDKNDTNDISFVIESGMTSAEIGKSLKSNNLIKNELLFKIYLKVNNVSSLKASTYNLKRSMSLKEIVDMLESGNSYNPDEIKITFKDGLRITDYAKVISDETNLDYDDVIKTFEDFDYAKKLVSEYWFLSDDILDSNIYYPLEGYLAPDTYHFANKDVSLDTIIHTLLDEMSNLLDEYKSKIEGNVHYYITMASLVELEGTNLENRKMIAGVFENRLASGMNLGSDVTTYYALQKAMTSDLTSSEFATVNPYNTRGANMIGKMPIGPICSVLKDSIDAAVNPTKSDYLFFVADKNGKIYYTKTNAEHEKKVQEIKANGDWIW